MLFDIEQGLADVRDKIADIRDKVKGITQPSLTTKGLVAAAQGRVAIVSGGYQVTGSICHVQMTIKTLAALAGNDYWSLISGLPLPYNGAAALSAVRPESSAPVNVDITDSGTLRMVFGNQATASGTKYVVTGSYFVGGGSA